MGKHGFGGGKRYEITESMAFNMRFEIVQRLSNHTNFLPSSVIGNANSSQFGQVTQGPHRVVSVR